MEDESKGRVEGLGDEKWASWLVPDGKEDKDFKNISSDLLKTQVRLLARRPDSMATPSSLAEVYDRIDIAIRDREVSLEDAALWQARIAKRHEQLYSSRGEPKVEPSFGKSFGEELAEAIHGKHLSQDEKYIEMQDDEQWNNDLIPPINPDATPGYYIDMTREERERHQTRLELANYAYLKRNKISPPTLEALSKEVPWAGLSKTETQKIYEDTPGVKEAVKVYVDLIDSGDPLITAKGRDGLIVMRQHIRKSIRGVVRMGTEDKISLEIKCRDAEQIAFNLLYLGNTFESLDSVWTGNERGRAPQITSELLIVPIKNAMKPLDNLIASLGKTLEKFSSVGRFGEWAYNQTRVANGGRELNLTNLREVRLVPETAGNQQKFWTVENGGAILYAPQCYPTKLIGSVWEETKAKMDDDSEVALIDFIRKGDPIPWDKVGGEDMWGTYGFRLGKAGALWDFLQGKNLIKWGDDDQIRLWVETVNSALSQFGLVKEAQLKRWMLYASTGIKAGERPPKLNDSGRRLDILGNLGRTDANYLPSANELLFPWDKSGRIFI